MCYNMSKGDVKMTKIKTQNLVLCSLFSAIIAICSWLTIPAAVPFTLQTFAIFAALLVLGGKWGTASICVYILLGAVGLPVFSGFKGGIGVLIGVTGGYILGFILSGLVFWIMEHFLGNSLLTKISAMILGLIICYTAGTAWFVITYTKNISVFGALKSCVIPFIIPDLLKMSFAVLVSERLKKSIKNKTVQI